MFLKPLKYACNTQLRRILSPSPYSLVLSRQPPSPSPLAASTNLPDGSADVILPQTMRAEIQCGITALGSKADVQAHKSQKRYKYDYGPLVLGTSVFKRKKYFFFNNLSLRSTADSNGGEMSKQVYNNLQPQKTGLFGIFTAQEKKLTIDEHETPRIVSIEKLTNAPETTGSNDRHSNEKLRNKNPVNLAHFQKNISQEQEFVVERNVLGTGTGPQQIILNGGTGTVHPTAQ